MTFPPAPSATGTSRGPRRTSCGIARAPCPSPLRIPITYRVAHLVANTVCWHQIQSSVTVLNAIPNLKSTKGYPRPDVIIVIIRYCGILYFRSYSSPNITRPSKTKLLTRTTSVVMLPRTLRPPKYSASKGTLVVRAEEDAEELYLLLLKTFQGSHW